MTKQQPEIAAEQTPQESMDEKILRLFATLRREEKQQVLTFFETALKTRSLPASDHRQHEKEAL